MRGTTNINLHRMLIFGISIHVPREGDDPAGHNGHLTLFISIHVPREGDDTHGSTWPESESISIHVPREGDDQITHRTLITGINFNPRPP